MNVGHGADRSYFPSRKDHPFASSLMFKVALRDIDDQRLSEELLYSMYIAYLFMSSPNDSIHTLYINYLHYKASQSSV